MWKHQERIACFLTGAKEYSHNVYIFKKNSSCYFLSMYVNPPCKCKNLETLILLRRDIYIYMHVGIYIHIKILYLLLYGISNGLFPNLNKPDTEVYHLFPQERTIIGIRLSNRQA